MQLTIKYRNGMTRVVNPIAGFFESAEIRQGYKTIIVTGEQKCMDIALDGGEYPYEIILMEGSNIVYKYFNKGWAPVEPTAEKDWAHTFVHKDTPTKKEVKELKNIPLTKKWIAGTEGLTWERGIRLITGNA